MMRAFTLVFTAILLMGHVARAEETPQAQNAAVPAILEHAPAGSVVFDDDGGRAQIIPQKRVAADKEATYHGGPVVNRGNVQAIFLGSAWRDEANRAREAQVASGLAAREHAGTLAKYGIEAADLPVLTREDLLDPLENRTISDLEVARRLDVLLTGGTFGPGPYEANAVFVIFLAPGLRSTLGNSSSEKDYAAYHNHFHTAAGVARYVVVPYETDVARWLANARKSLVQALINPEGNGWY